MKKVTLEEINDLMECGSYVCEQCAITQKNINRASQYIEKLRELHKKLGCFVRYTCECSSLTGSTTWYFIYKSDEHEKLEINMHTNAIWNEIFPERPAGLEPSAAQQVASIFNEPCVCPFSEE